MSSSSEFYLRRLLRTLARRKYRHRLIAAKQRIRPDDAGERPQLGIIDPRRFDVVAPSDRDAILRPFKLRLKCKKVLIGFEIRIVLTDGNQPAKRAAELVLRILELF